MLSESYLYTVEMIGETLDHLTADGLICMHFGEYDFAGKPNRTTRYMATAREAFENYGIRDFPAHALVATSPSLLEVSTMLLKKSAFTESEIERFFEVVARVSGTVPRYVPGSGETDERLRAVIELSADRLAQWHEDYPYEVTPVRDDSPFFWHFAPFGRVLHSVTERANTLDTEDSAGERSLIGMLAVGIVFAAVFLLLPFVAIRETWRRLPHKATTAVYFAALGLGFMFYEIVLIQKLVLFLGYPTYSLTVTLMSLLVFTGIGSLAMQRRLTTGGIPTAVLLLGCFMPLGLAAVAGLAADHADEYVAWSWAVNGFFSVIGSVLTTILSMSFGFSTVLGLGFVVYGVAVFSLSRIRLPAS